MISRPELVTAAIDPRPVRLQFLEETSVFYAREAQRWVQEDGLPDYLVKVRLLHYSVGLVSGTVYQRHTDSRVSSLKRVHF